MIKEHERIVLAKSIPSLGLVAGDVGTVIHLHKGHKAFEVEFVTLDGHALGVDTVRLSDVRPVGCREVMHARSLAH